MNSNNNMQINNIIKKMNESLHNYDVNICHNICDEIIKLDSVPNIMLLKRFVTYITVAHNIYYSHEGKKYITDSYTKNKVEECIKYMLPYIDLSDEFIKETIKLLLIYDAFYIIKFLPDHSYDINNELLESMMDYGNLNTVREIIKYYPNIVNNNTFDISIDMNLFSLTDELIKKFNIKPSVQNIEHLLKKRNDGSSKVLKLIIDNGLSVNRYMLELACIYNNKDLAYYAFENKMEPDRKLFNIIVESDNYNRLHSKYPYIYSKKPIPPHQDEKVAMIKILVSFGYNISYEDILFATSERIDLSVLDSLNITFDEKFLELCSEIGFYPNYKTKDIKYNLSCLEKECARSGNLKEIKKIIKMGIKPSTKALENASCHKNNIQSIRYLIENGVKPNLQCIKNIAKELNNSTLILLLNEYQKNIDIENLNKIKNDNLINLEDDSDNTSNSNDSISDDNVPIISEHEENVIEDDSSESSSDIMSDPEPESESESEPKSKNLDISKKKILKEDNNSKILESEIVTIPEPKKKIDQRLKIKFNQSTSKLLNLKKDNTLSFLELRKKFFEYFSKNSLYDNNNKLLIKIDKKMSQSLKLEENKYFHFNDLDNLIYNIIEKN